MLRGRSPWPGKWGRGQLRFSPSELRLNRIKRKERTKKKKVTSGWGRGWGRRLLLEHVLQRPRQVFEHRVQDALLLLFLLIPAACWDGLLGPGQAPLAGLLQGCLLLGLLLLLLLQPILGRGRVERGVNGARRELSPTVMQSCTYSWGSLWELAKPRASHL